MACEQGHIKVVEVLLEAGVDIEAKDEVWIFGMIFWLMKKRRKQKNKSQNRIIFLLF